VLDFPRWKVWGIILVLLAGVLLAIPSLMPESTARGLGLGGMPRINLGLDLSGGSHLKLEADTADLAKQNLAKMEDTIRTEMRRGDTKIGIGDISTANGRISFFVRDIAQLDAAVERARQQTTAVGVTGQRDWNVAVVDATRIVMTQTQTGLDAAVDSAMNVATEVVRKRIDDRHARADDRARRQDRILVQVPGLQDPSGLKALLGKTAKLEFKLVDLTADPAAVARTGRLRVARSCPIRAIRVARRRSRCKRRVIISGDDLIDAQIGTDQNQQSIVSITFNAEGPQIRPRDAGEYGQAVRDDPRRLRAVGAEHQ
jgi:preprotein translocase subunit SecD